MATPRKIRAIITEVLTHSERIKSLLIAPKQKWPRFHAGQFLHLAIDPYDPSYPWPESRVFSIASSPSSELIRITFAIKGKFTQMMYDSLMPGDEVWIKLPYGDFRFEENCNKLVFIAGGTGITPYIPFLEENLDSSKFTNIHLYYGIERLEHFIFTEVIQKNLELNSNFRLSLYVENNQSIFNVSIRKAGKIDFEHILSDCTLVEEFYLSGPEEMINVFEKQLIANRVKEAQIHIDRWQ